MENPGPVPRPKVASWRASELLLTPNAPSRHELAGTNWVRLHKGVVAWAHQELAAPALRIRAAAQAVPGAALGMWAAAYAHGARELDGGYGRDQIEPITFCLGESGTKRPRNGLVPIRTRLDEGDVVKVGDLTVTSPARTAFDLARSAKSLQWAVADVDCLLRARPRVLTVAQFAEYVDTKRGFTGVAQARACIPLLSPLSRSRPESALRVIWVVDAGLPMPLVNPKVFHRITGRLLGLPDALDAESGLVGEYDGAQHRDLQNHSDDNIREEAFEDAGLTVVRVTAVDFRTPEQLVRRLQAGYARARRNPLRNWFLGS